MNLGALAFCDARARVHHCLTILKIPFFAVGLKLTAPSTPSLARQTIAASVW